MRTVFCTQTAKDKGTGKEQKIHIGGVVLALSKDEAEKMKAAG